MDEVKPFVKVKHKIFLGHIIHIEHLVGVFLSYFLEKVDWVTYLWEKGLARVGNLQNAFDLNLLEALQILCLLEVAQVKKGKNLTHFINYNLPNHA